MAAAKQMGLNGRILRLICLCGLVLAAGCGENGAIPNRAWWVKDYPAPVADESIDEEVVLTVRIRFTGAPSLMCGDVETYGCAYHNGDIEIVAQRAAGGGIVFLQAIMGHELAHQLNFQHPELFPDPDAW